MRKDVSTVIDTVNKTIGINIRRRRIARGLSRPQLAKDTGLSIESIRQYEDGTADIKVKALLAISAVLTFPLVEFLPTSEQPLFSDNTEDQKILSMMQSFLQIPSTNMQESIGSLIKTAAKEFKSLETNKDSCNA